MAENKSAKTPADDDQPVAWFSTSPDGKLSNKFAGTSKEVNWQPVYTAEQVAAAIAAEREKVAQWMMTKGYATGHGDTIEDLMKELDWQIRELEREACVRLFKDKEGLWDAEGIAATIRGEI